MKTGINPCIVFTGGGTGGHIYPGLAVADEIRELDKVNENSPLLIIWIGSSSGMDRTIVEKSGKSIDRFIGIPSGKMRRYFSLKNIADIFKIFAGCVSAFFYLSKLKPRVVFSKGGFVSVPPCFAAKLLGIPVVTHECDYSPGLATRLNSKFASRILLSFAATSRFFSSSKQSILSVTGNPVRPVFYNTNVEKGLEFLKIEKSKSKQESSKPILLVLGGSSGALQINKLILENLTWLCERFIVVHQTGVGNYPGLDSPELTSNSFEKEHSSSESYKPYEFIYADMPNVIAAADIVLSRAGSNSLWECAVLGKPLVLIPLAGEGTRGDQIENANFFQESNAAIVLDGLTANSESLKMALSQMLNKETRISFANAAKRLAGNERPAKKIAEILLKFNK